MKPAPIAEADALYFVGPRAVALRREPLGELGPGELSVTTHVSAISAGTERLAYAGELPAALAVDETLGALGAQSFRYPFRYGYASVGTVMSTGANVPARWQGQRVFAFCPHASAAHVPCADVVAVPEGLSDEGAVLLASMETAVNLVLDAVPLLGERVVVIGQGVIGLLATALLGAFPLASLTAVETNPARAALALRFGASQSLTPEEAMKRAHDADLVLELSGRPEALNLALALAGQEARVVVGSWYGERRAPLDLGGSFHRRRLRLVSSQVSHIAPALAARWNRARRFEAAFTALARCERQGLLAALVSHRVPFASVGEAYALLAGEAALPSPVLQILLVHDATSASSSFPERSAP